MKDTRIATYHRIAILLAGLLVAAATLCAPQGAWADESEPALVTATAGEAPEAPLPDAAEPASALAAEDAAAETGDASEPALEVAQDDGASAEQEPLQAQAEPAPLEAQAESTPLQAQAELASLRAQDASGPIADGDYVIRSLLASQSVLDVAGGSAASGANVQLYAYNGSNAQKWRFAYDAASGFYTITNLISNMALDVAGASTRNGSNIQVYSPNGTKAQLWGIVQDGSGWRIVSALSTGFALDIAGGSSANGANAQGYEANGTNAQRFELVSLAPDVPVSTAVVADGAYVLRSAASDKVVDVAGGSRKLSANVQQYPANSAYAQRFYLESDGAGYYRVFSVGSGLALDVACAGILSGTNVQQYSFNGTSAQLWSLQQNDDGTLTFLSKANGLALDIAGASSADGANVQVYASNGTAAQHFSLEPVDLLSAGTISLNSAAVIGRVLDVKGASTSAEAALQIYDYNGTSAQKYIMEGTAAGGFTLQSVRSGLYAAASAAGAILQSDTASTWTAQFSSSGERRGIVLVSSDNTAATITGTDNSSALALAALTGAPEQAFCPITVALIDDGIYTVANMASGKMLDIADGSWRDGANVQIWGSNGSGAQAFRIESVGGGYYRIMSAMTGRAVDVQSALNADGANVQQWSWNGSDAQLWKAEFSDAGCFVFVNKATGKVLEVAGGSTEDGANAQIWTENGSKAQGWRIDPTAYTPDPVLQNALNQVNGRSSSTPYIIAVDRGNTRVMVFEGSQGNWTPIQNYLCSCGAPGSQTITGDYYVGSRGYSFGDSDHTCYYYTQISGGYLFHSVLYYPGTHNVKDGRLGYHISMGCVRLDINDAKWIHDTIPGGTHIYIYN